MDYKFLALQSWIVCFCFIYLVMLAILPLFLWSSSSYLNSNNSNTILCHRIISLLLSLCTILSFGLSFFPCILLFPFFLLYFFSFHPFSLLPPFPFLSLPPPKSIISTVSFNSNIKWHRSWSPKKTKTKHPKATRIEKRTIKQIKS